MRQENMTREIGPRLSFAFAKGMEATKSKSRSKWEKRRSYGGRCFGGLAWSDSAHGLGHLFPQE